MSIVHVRLRKTDFDANNVVYAVESPDFCPDRSWQSLGILTIDIVSSAYEFAPSMLATESRLTPPAIAASAVSTVGLYWKLWSLKIHHFGNSVLKNLDYPDQHP